MVTKLVSLKKRVLYNYIDNCISTHLFHHIPKASIGENNIDELVVEMTEGFFLGILLLLSKQSNGRLQSTS
jgi:hypothetical protein